MIVNSTHYHNAWDSNRIGCLSIMQHLPLKRLDLSFNQIKELPSNIGLLPSDCLIKLEGNPLKMEDIFKFLVLAEDTDVKDVKEGVLWKVA